MDELENESREWRIQGKVEIHDCYDKPNIIEKCGHCGYGLSSQTWSQS